MVTKKIEHQIELKKNPNVNRFELWQQVMRHRDVILGKLQPHERAQLEDEAFCEKQARNRKIIDEIDELRERRKLINAREAESQRNQDGIVNKMSSFKFDGEGKRRFNEMYKRVATSITEHDLRNQFKGSPKAPDEATQAILVDAGGQVDGSHHLPAWMNGICRNRDMFFRTAIYEGSGLEPMVVWMPLIMLESPYTVVWNKLSRYVEHPHIHGFGQDALDDLPDSFVTTYFTYTDTFLCDVEPAFSEHPSLWVLEDLQFVRGQMVRAPHEAVSYEEFTRHHCRPHDRATTSRSGSTRMPDAIKAQILLEFPWLTDEDFNERKTNPDGNAPKSSRGDHAASHKEDVVRPAFDVAELAKELISDRITYAHDVDRNMHFYVHNRGGQDTNRRLGMSSDYATVFARNSGRPFCRAYNWPSQKGYGHLKYGGIRNSNFLAREFARISHHFCFVGDGKLSWRFFIFS